MAEESKPGTYGLQIGTLEAGRAWIGRPVEARVGEIDVNEAMIRQFVSAIRDPNPDYWRSPPSVPPAMLTTWVTPQNWRPDRTTGPAAALLVAVPMPGDSMINISSEIELFEPLRLGDRIEVVEEVESISDEKATRVGPGHFLTIAARYRRQSGELVALQRNTILRFWARPGDATAASSAGGAGGARGEGATSDASTTSASSRTDGEGSASAPAEGDLLPECIDVLDVERVVASAAATWTFFGGHIDPDYARGVQGRDHVYLATGPVLGMLDAYVLNALGRGARLVKRSIRMDRSLCAGDRIVLRGRVVRRWTGSGTATGSATATANGPAAARSRSFVEVETVILGAGDRACVRSTSTVELADQPTARGPEGQGTCQSVTR